MPRAAVKREAVVDWGVRMSDLAWVAEVAALPDALRLAGYNATKCRLQQA